MLGEYHVDSTRQATMRRLGDGRQEILHENGEFVLYRERSRSSSNEILQSTLVLAPVPEHTAPHSLRRIEHEYSLRAELDPA